MNKKHFIQLADEIRMHNKFSDEPFTDRQIKLLADFCKRQNHNFMRERWIDYIHGLCGPGGGKLKESA